MTMTNRDPSQTLPPEVILRGYSRATDQDIEAARQATGVEREWYDGYTRYPDVDRIKAAYSLGRLVKVFPTDLYRPITRFLNPVLHDRWPPFLSEGAYIALDSLAVMWRRQADVFGVGSEVRLSVTSLTRSVVYQDELIANGKLAVADSTHTAGGAFDIDLSGYYEVNGTNTPAVISLRTPEEQAPIRQAFNGRELGAAGMHPFIRPTSEFDPAVSLALVAAADAMAEEGLINRVVEFPGTNNSCLHIAANPNVFTGSR